MLPPQYVQSLREATLNIIMQSMVSDIDAFAQHAGRKQRQYDRKLRPVIRCCCFVELIDNQLFFCVST